jgi:activator of HSP90 ATPase
LPPIIALVVVFLKREFITIKQTVIIPKVAPQQVYEAYVDPKKHSVFTGSKATGKPVVGGKFTAYDDYIFGEFLELEEGKRVVQEWVSTDFPEGYPPSKLELTFHEVPEGTKIVMIQSDVPKGQADDIAEGWTEFYWTPLREYFAKQSKSNLKNGN